MSPEILISNQSFFKIDNKLVKDTVTPILMEEGFLSAEVSIAFIKEEEMRAINRKYRKKDRATDILSFPHDGTGLERTGINFIGEIIICPSAIKIDNKEEIDGIKKVLIHGILHLLGYDHEKSEKDEIIMSKKELYYFKK